MNTYDTRCLALDLLDWHGGQWSGLYSVGSCMFSGHLELITQENVDRAIRELFDCQDRQAKRVALTLKVWWQEYQKGTNQNQDS